METKFKSTNSKIALLTVMTALTVVTNLIMVPMPQPLAEYDLSPVMIYSLGILMDPLLALISIALAMGIGVGYKVALYGFPPIFIIGAMLVRGLEAGLISYLVRWREQKEFKTITIAEIAAMVIGAVWETVGFYTLDWYLFGPGLAQIDLLTIVDVVFIPIAVAVVALVRRSYKVIKLT
jgi:uncharacterized membrane protein